VGKYRTLGTLFNRVFRNDLNQNFEDIDADIKAQKTYIDSEIATQKKRVDDLIINTPQPSEVVDARGGHPVLRDRLDSVDVQLSEIDQEVALTKTSLAGANTNITNLQINKADKTYVDTQLSYIGDGSPKGTFSTLAELQSAFPTGTSGIYVVTADGKWYYWNGTAWTPGGIYQATALGDKTVTRSKMATRYLFASFVRGGAVIDTTNMTVEILPNTIITMNGSFFSLSGQTLTYTNPNNRVMWVYYNLTTNTVNVYENGTMPNDGDLVLLFSFYNGKVTDCLTPLAITIDSKPNGGWNYGGHSITDDFSMYTLNALGDSITFGAGGNVPYPTVVKNALGLNAVRNYGVSGTSVAIRSGRTDSFIERYPSMDNNAQIIYVMGGTNDFWTNVPLGTMGDTDPTTYYGALDTLVKGLINKYPNAFICFGTPPKGWRESGYYNEGPNNNGNTMEQFNKAVKDVCGYYTIPVLDVKHELGIDPSLSSQFSAFTSDGIHFNDDGYQKLGKLVARFIRSKINI
jgi:lysophospholipase L1-like esterase